MSTFHDPELDDVLQDDELRHLAAVLSSARRQEPPVDDAFRTGLRRQLMTEAWEISQGRDAWWRRLFAPPGLAWAGALTGLLLIAAVVVWTAEQPAGGLTQVVASSSLDGKNSVPLAQPILVSFNQPMNHQTTENAVQIMPATNVTFSWDQNTLAVQPAAGNLAPNTQYQVTIGPTATTASGQHLNSTQTITFVTQAPPAPTPTPTPRPTPTPVLGEARVASLGGASSLLAQWAPDSSSVYFVDGKGALNLVSAKGGSVTTIASSGVTSLAISPAGDRLAYVEGGKIEVLTFATGKTDEVAPSPAALLVGWAKDKLVWATADAIYEQGDSEIVQIFALPAGTVAISIAPDAANAIYRKDQSLFLAHLGTTNSVSLGQPGATFQGWAPDGTLLVYASGDNIIVADTQGATQTTIPASGEATWSAQDAILVGSDTLLFEVHPDGSNGTRVSSGTYHYPLWAPNSALFAFVRGGSLYVATAVQLPPIPAVIDQASTVVTNFMGARLKGDADQASALLTDNGKRAYGVGGMALVINGDPRFSRYYVLTQEVVSASPDTARFVVRLVLTHGKIDIASYEETLTLVRDPSTKAFVIDQATGGAHRDLGKGAEVVNVVIAADTVKVTFDSDLDPGTITGGLVVLDSKGKQVDATATYSDKTVTLTGINLKEGETYRLVVMTSVRDVLGHNVAAEYDLDFVGPSEKKHGNHGVPVTVTPSPSPSPSASASPGGNS